MNVLVTGATGFIGSHLVPTLLESDVPVRVAHSSARSLATFRDAFPQVEHVVADVTDPRSVREAVRDVETVYHLAGVGSPGSPHANDLDILHVNVSGTCALLQEATAAGVRRFVFASSASVYGDGPESPKTETMPTLPKSVYAASKTAAEDLCLVFQSQRGLDARILRLFNVYGTGQAPNMAVPHFIELLSQGKPVTLYGDGSQIRDFIHVSDVVDALVRAGTVERVAAPVLNIGSGSPTTIRDIVESLAAILGVRPDLELLPERPGEIRESVANIDAARANLGFSPQTAIHDGLLRTCPAPAMATGSVR